MSSLTRFENNGLELVIDIETGEAFATQAGYCRMSGKAKMTISDRMKGVRSEDIKTAEILTPGGLQGVRLIPAKLIFKWLMKDSPELAEAMGEYGATKYLHKLAGYEEKPVDKPIQKLYTSIEKADTINKLASSLQFFGIAIDNPRFKQGLQDLVGDILGLTLNKTLPESHEIWLGVTERAEQLGYPVALVTKHRSVLGKYVKASGLEFKEEKRLCNGTQRDIKLYKLTPDLDQAIKEFMDVKSQS